MRSSPGTPTTPRRVRSGSTRSCAGAERTSPVVRTRVRSSPTRPTTPRAGLIEACGLKGLRVGGAVVSEKHANFFVAEPDARADDVHALVRLVQARVVAATGVRLVPELQFVGFADTSEEARG